MQRIQHASATGSIPSPNSTGQIGYFGRGVSPTTLPTNVTADWANGIQEELAAQIEGGGKTLILTDNTLLYGSTLNLVNRKAGLFNAVLNGNFDLWQRGTSVTGFTTGPTYLADRFIFRADTHGTWTMARDTDVPNADSLYSVKLSCTTADASVAAGSFVSFEQRIEGYRWNHFKNNKLTLSFWVRSTTTGTYYVSLANDQVNLGATVNNYFRITGVQVEAGDKATDFEYRPISEELALCQRYYEKTYDLSTTPGTITNDGLQHIYTNSTGGVSFNPRFAVHKRIIPTFVMYSPNTGVANNFWNGTVGVDVAFIGLASYGQSGFHTSGVGGLPAGTNNYFHWTADAEL